MTFSGFGLTIIAATIAGVIVHRVKDADLWQLTAYINCAFRDLGADRNKK